MHGNRDARGVALREIVSFQQPRDRVTRAKTYDLFIAHLPQPFAVEPNLRFLGIQDLKNLILIGFGIGLDILARERGPRGVAAGWVSDHSGGVADQEDDLMAHVLKMFHLPQQNGVAEVQIGGRRVETRFHAERLSLTRAEHQALPQILLANHLCEALAEVGQLFFRTWRH